MIKDKWNLLKKSKKVYLIIGLIAIVTLVFGITYATFIMSTSPNRASEMMISKLTYGVSIKNYDDTTTGISGKTVTLGANEERQIKITLKSLNEIKSKYKLQYISTGNVTVKYINPTPSPTSGQIDEENGVNDEVIIHIYVLNNQSSSTTITFGTKGGYTHNDVTEIALIQDYTAIVNPYSLVLKDNILESNPLRVGTPDFSQISTSADTGLWSAPDDYGTSQYFRGNKDMLNNNVIFGGYQWKIIRITGSGDIKLIYNGECSSLPCTINDTLGGLAGIQFLSGSVFNEQYDLNKYVGYMYGSTCTTYATCHANDVSSTIKGVIDNWYNTQMPTASKILIADTIYCNDRSLVSGTGVGTVGTNYGVNNRLITNKNPILTCPQKNDAFTVSDTVKGNGALTYPVGLATADEFAMSGFVRSFPSSESFIAPGSGWSMTPLSFNDANNNVYVFYSHSSGDIGGGNISYAVIGIRQVISLKSASQITKGNGSTTNPYVIFE